MSGYAAGLAWALLMLMLTLGVLAWYCRDGAR